MEQITKPIMADTIAAVATPPGTGGIAVIRVSGPDAISIADKAWKGRSLSRIPSHSVSLGKYFTTDDMLLDEAVATVFRAPRSFTGEDVVEISVHGSRWIQREMMADLVRRGVRVAGPGEFTQRAFLNHRLDLAQAEGVADLISASSRASHQLAISQTKGNFSRELEELRDKLVDFASLLELELDFSEEDVEFADRTRLLELARHILMKVERLANSYASGAVIKDGMPVVIAGIPNAGKSSLLNLLLGEDKAIVTDIPGTTRDIIEDTIEIDGILYRFIDTAGLRTSTDAVESIGIDRARTRMRNASIVIWVLDPTSAIEPQVKEYTDFRHENPDSKIIILINKTDLADSAEMRKAIEGLSEGINGGKMISFSTKTGAGYQRLRGLLQEFAIGDYDPQQEFIVTNARHYESLTLGATSLRRAIEGIETGLSSDFVAQDVRETLHHLGTITGAVPTDTLLHTIFSRFCIGK